MDCNCTDSSNARSSPHGASTRIPSRTESSITYLEHQPTGKESIALSKDLKKRGWNFIGPTTVYAFVQAIGLINDHSENCVVVCLCTLVSKRRNRDIRSCLMQKKVNRTTGVDPIAVKQIPAFRHGRYRADGRDRRHSLALKTGAVQTADCCRFFEETRHHQS